MASLREVSQRAGVTISTVSRYLSGALNVRPETEERILAAVRAVDYRPNDIARALKQRKTRTVGVIVPSSANPLFAEIVGGIYSVLCEQDYSYIQMASENDLKREKQCFQTLQNKQVDGLLVVGSAVANDAYDQWLADGDIRETPIVFINRMYDKPQYTRVLNDFDQGSYSAVEHFLSTGRKHIAMLSGIPGLEESIVKEKGYYKCLADHGITPDSRDMVYGHYHFEEGFRAARQLLESVRPDAILAVNDLSAIAALSCANSMGIRVPEDLAVIGYGNSEASAFTFPALSTIDQDKRFSGQRGAQLLLDMLEEKPVQSEVVRTTLILRNSC